MDFNIKYSGSGETGDDLTVIIQKAEPGFSFLPEQVNTGIYLITLERLIFNKINPREYQESSFWEIDGINVHFK